MQLPKFIQHLAARLERSPQQPQIRNLVFKGGGVRGIAYLGAVQALDEMGMLQHVERAAGTSAGAITAALYSFRLPVTDTFALFNTLDITKVPQLTHKDLPEGDRPRDRLRRFIHTPDLDAYNRFFNNYGWYSSQYFYEWLQGIIAQQCDGNGMATFADFRQRGFRDLHIVATNVSRQRPEYFSACRTPHVAVADAVRLSMSIPMFFEALQFDGQHLGSGDYYVDGGLYDNFPITIFDDPKYAHNPRAFREGINWETVGLFLYPEAVKKTEEPLMPRNVWAFSSLIIQSMYRAYEVSGYQTNPIDQRRTIEISDCGIASTEFSITQGSEKYLQLYRAGRSAAERFVAEME